MSPGKSPSRDDLVNLAIAAYLQAVDRGEYPDRAKFLAEHADIASELKSFLDNAAHFGKIAGCDLPRPEPGIIR